MDNRYPPYRSTITFRSCPAWFLLKFFAVGLVAVRCLMLAIDVHVTGWIGVVVAGSCGVRLAHSYATQVITFHRAFLIVRHGFFVTHAYDAHLLALNYRFHQNSIGRMFDLCTIDLAVGDTVITVRYVMHAFALRLLIQERQTLLRVLEHQRHAALATYEAQ